MAPGIFSDLKNFCCCVPKTDDDQERLVGDQSDIDWITASRTTNQNRNGVLNYSAGSHSSRGPLENQIPAVKTQNEVEEDALNKILDRTQQVQFYFLYNLFQSIIDVSNLDNSPVDIDVLQRSRLYSDAIKRHDSEMDRKKLAAHEDNTINKTHLLTEVGSNANEILSRPTTDILSLEEFAWLSKATDSFHNAFRGGAQIECKEELIAYMSLDD